MKTSIVKIATILTVLIFGNTSFAQTKIANANGDWFNPAIWTPAGVPFMADSVIINSQVTFNQTLDARGSSFKMFRINSGASLKSVGMNDTLILGVVDYLINSGSIQAAFIAWGDITVFASNNGSIKTTGDIAESDDFYNLSGGFIQVGNNLITSSNFTNNIGGVIVITNSLITSDKMVNNGDISSNSWINAAAISGTTGKFCVAGRFINGDNITGTVDICDATPNTIWDFNNGTIAGSITYCAHGPCSQTISTGIAKQTGSNEVIKIYPNPASNFISINNKTTEKLNLEIINAIGQKVNTYEVHGDSFRIDLSDLTSGVYFFITTNGMGQVSSQKIIVEK